MDTTLDLTLRSADARTLTEARGRRANKSPAFDNTRQEAVNKGNDCGEQAPLALCVQVA
jgi:hypothetical protein